MLSAYVHIALSTLVFVAAASNYISDGWPTIERPTPGQVIGLAGQSIFVRDASLDHAYIDGASMTVPGWLLWSVCLGANVGGLLLAHASRREAAVAAPLWCYSMAGTSLLTDAAKHYCGVFRPNYYGGCAFDDALRQCTRPFHGGKHSFPSGHSSVSACAATLLVLHMLRALEAADVHKAAGCCGLRRGAAALLRASTPLPLAVAGWIAASRVHDNYHAAADVTAGCCLGLACALLGWRCAFPAAGAGPRFELLESAPGRARRETTAIFL